MRAHLLDSDSPLKEGSDVTALCGQEVHGVHFVYMFDQARDPQFLEAMNSLNLCRKCYQIEIEKRYVYGIVPGQETLHREVA